MNSGGSEITTTEAEDIETTVATETTGIINLPPKTTATATGRPPLSRPRVAAPTITTRQASETTTTITTTATTTTTTTTATATAEMETET